MRTLDIFGILHYLSFDLREREKAEDAEEQLIQMNITGIFRWF